MLVVKATLTQSWILMRVLLPWLVKRMLNGLMTVIQREDGGLGIKDTQTLAKPSRNII